MKCPQKLAQELSQIKTIEVQSHNACCAYVFLWCLGIEPDDVEAIKLVDEAIRKNYIEPDCTVWWGKWGAALTGREILITKNENIKTIKDIKERTPVWYSKDGKNGHWVGVQNGVIKFDPYGSGRSENVKNGKPMKSRTIKIGGLIK